jgi:two-component system CheB/CheR fusion protein
LRKLEAAYKAAQATNEELQSTIEELEATNEELKFTNEALETMNEELQWANEELEAVNEQLRRRGMDLVRSNLFLSGVLRSVPLAVVVLSDTLVVELWNDVAADMWGLRQSEVQGQPFLSLDIGMPLEPLRQPLLTLLQMPGRPSELTLAATNRRGESMTLRVYCVSAGSGIEGGRGVILLMQETSADVRQGMP